MNEQQIPLFLMPTPIVKAKKLTPAGARHLARADAKVAKAKKALEHEEREREKVRAKFRHLCPDGQELIVGEFRDGYKVKRIWIDGKPFFSLEKYLEAGHELPHKADGMKDKAGHERWYISALAGPYLPGSVEPSGA